MSSLKEVIESFKDYRDELDVEDEVLATLVLASSIQDFAATFLSVMHNIDHQICMGLRHGLEGVDFFDPNTDKE